MKIYPKLLTPIILLILILTFGCDKNNNNSLFAQEVQSCPTTAPTSIKLGNNIIFCINSGGSYSPEDRAYIIERRLEKIATDFTYNLESISFDPSSLNNIVISTPGSENVSEPVLTLLSEDRDKNNKLLSELKNFDENIIETIIKTAIRNHRLNKYNSQYIAVELLDNYADVADNENQNGLLNQENINSFFVCIILSFFLLPLVPQQVKRWVFDRIRPPLEPLSLTKTIESMKKQLFEVQDNAGSKSKNAMFTLGSATINLKTVVDNESELKVAPLSLLENSLSSSNQQTQDLKLVFNPLKVFSRKVGTVKITFKNKGCVYYEGVTESDLVDINDTTYLWIRKGNKEQEWIDTTDINNIKAIASQSVTNSKVLEILFKNFDDSTIISKLQDLDLKKTYNAKDFVDKFENTKIFLDELLSYCSEDTDWNANWNEIIKVSKIIASFRSEFNKDFQNKEIYLQLYTIKTLNELDSTYKKFVIKFLYERDYIKTDSNTSNESMKIKLEDADLQNIDLVFSIIQHENWQNINLSRSNLKQANLQRINLNNAILRGATLTDAKLENADLSETIFYDAIFAEDESKTIQQLKSANNYDKAHYYEDKNKNKDFIKKLKNSN